MFGPILLHPFALETTITMDNAVVPLSRLCAEMAATTSKRFELNGFYANKKVTALFENQPVSTVMSRLEEVFDGKWERTEKGYLFEPNAGMVREFRDAQKRYGTLKDRNLQIFFDQAKQMNKLSTKEIELMRQRSRTELPPAPESFPDSDYEKVQSKRMFHALLMYRGFQGFPSFIEGIENPIFSQLRENGTAAVSTKNLSGVIGVEGSKFARLLKGMQEVEPNKVYIGVLKLLDNGNVSLRMITGRDKIEIGAMLTFSIDPIMPSYPYVSRIDSWSSKITQEEPLQPDAFTPLKKSNVGLPRALRAIRTSTKIPILAEATRKAISEDPIPVHRTLGSLCETLRKRGARFKVSDGWILARDRHAFAHELTEIPENTISGLEQAFNADGMERFWRAIPLLGGLSDGQADRLDSDDFPEQTSMARLWDISACRYLNLLSSAEQRAYVSDSPRRLIMRSQTQVQAARQMLLEGLGGIKTIDAAIYTVAPKYAPESFWNARIVASKVPGTVYEHVGSLGMTESKADMISFEIGNKENVTRLRFHLKPKAK